MQMINEIEKELLEEIIKNWFVIKETDKTFTAYLRFGNFEKEEDAKFYLNLILTSIGLEINDRTSIH